MGMAASQARFLGLTARKTNLEYEGQQINQQRTALGNTSANYYNSMLGMSVPVPPSVDNYTKTVYSFNDGALENTITSLISAGGGNYTISYLKKWTDDFSMVSAASSIVTKSANKTGAPSTHLTAAAANNGSYVKIYDAATSQFTENTYDGTSWSPSAPSTTLPSAVGSYVIIYDAATSTTTTQTRNAVGGTGLEGTTQITTNDKGTHTTKTPLTGAATDTNGKYMIGGQELRLLGNLAPEDQYLSTLPASEKANLQTEETAYLSLLQSKYGDGDYVVRYIQNSTTGKWVPYFYKESDLTNNNTAYDTSTGNSQSAINCYTIGSEKKTEEIKAVQNCRIEQDSTGRLINLSIPASGGGLTTYALTTTTVTDQDKYNDAMNQYEFEKFQYDQTIQDINAKIAVIQSQDKNLELRLKQLDTEQNAVQTEMDAVSKVIQKNVEGTFKTFG
jgi:hypothetical protein